MSSLFLPDTPRNSHFDQSLIRKNVQLSASKENKLTGDEADLFLKIQNTKDEVLEIESENIVCDDQYLKKTPTKKKDFYKKESAGTKKNKPFMTPNKYFNEDILNSVPKTKKFLSSVEYPSLFKSSNMKSTKKRNQEDLGVNKYKDHFFKKSFCKFKKTKSSCELCTIPKSKFVSNKTKELTLSILNIISDFFLYQLPSALILYGIALYLLPNKE